MSTLNRRRRRNRDRELAEPRTGVGSAAAASNGHRRANSVKKQPTRESVRSGDRRPCVRRVVRQARPAPHVAQPGDVRRRDRRGRSRRVILIGNLFGGGDDQTWFVAWITALALVHRPLRQLRRGDGRRARQGAGRHAAQDPHGDHGQGPGRRRPRPDRVARLRRAAPGRPRPGRGGRHRSRATAR